MRRLGSLLACLLLLVAMAPCAHAHVGSKDIYEDVTAGPYKFFITIRPPLVIPGTATVEFRSVGAPVEALEITPLPMTGEGTQFAPQADTLHGSQQDPAFFSGGFWLMQQGSWRLRVTVHGSAGLQTTAVAVPAVAFAVTTMDRTTSLLLSTLGAFLFLSLIAIVVAAVRESRLRPGVAAPTGPWRLLGTGVAGFLVALAIVSFGAHWWKASAAAVLRGVYQPIALSPMLRGNQLDLRLHVDPKANRPLSDFILDHGHLMHLYVLREPQMDVIYHLHPDQVATGDFRLALPALPAGSYQLYGDVVHASGFPETVTARLEIPAGMPGRPLVGDDAEGQQQPLSAGMLGTTYRFTDGYTMHWERPAKLAANTGYQFTFHLLDPMGRPAPDPALYMGMSGHAAFVKTDGTVFAHVHPEGSASMAAMMLANEVAPAPGVAASFGSAGMQDMPAMSPAMEAATSTVQFPYGFPTPGRYRIFVQMKHGSQVETGAFDCTVQ